MNKGNIKKVIVLAVLLATFGISCATAGGARGDGNMTTIEKNAGSFNEIEASGSVTVNYYRSREHRVSVTVDANLEKYVDIYTRAGTLYIKTKSWRPFSPTEYIVDVYSPGLTYVSLSGSVRFRGKGPISGRDLGFNISGSGRAEGAFECEKFSVNISGSGRLASAGKSDNLDITVSGSGSFEGSEFQTNNADIRLSGSAKIDVWVLDTLTANTSGSARVRYRGNPKINHTSSGSGRLESL